MAQNSGIEWTDATWNPVTGCTKISAGCDHCYAERFSERFRGVPGHPFEMGFNLKLRPERLQTPLSWRKPRMIFVNSMSDLFHKDVPGDFVAQVFDTMELAHWHTFQMLTKRSSRIRDYVNRRYRVKPVPAHIWLGVSVEHRQAVSRVRHLQETNATVRFLSVEPLIEDVGEFSMMGLHWVIAGGESGPGARPMKPEWASRVRDMCLAQGVPFFFKQWGAFGADGQRRSKQGNGRTLDGRTWDQLPSHKGNKLTHGTRADEQLAL
jgi:protein gp37